MSSNPSATPGTAVAVVLVSALVAGGALLAVRRRAALVPVRRREDP